MKWQIVTATTAIAASSVGFAAGYFIAKRRLESQYEKLASREIAEAKELYRRLFKKDEFATPSSTVVALRGSTLDNAVEALRTYQGQPEEETSEESPTEEPEVVEKNIFTNGLPTADEVAEDETQIISEEQFLENGLEFDQVSLTWFQGDKVLVDERDQPIEAIEQTVGDCLKYFEQMPEDSHLLYVRNPRMQMEFEISRSMGKYKVEVLGFQDGD